jgi:putative membrane protein
MMPILTVLPDFLLDFAVATALVALYLAVYTFATAHNEFALIRRNVPSAALALGLSLVGFAIPLSSAMVFATTFVGLVLWGIVALVVQIVVYGLVRLVLPDLSARIAKGEIAPALFLGAAAVAAGLINASAMRF